MSNASSKTAWLVYADAYSPGWHAKVNGKPLPVIKAYTAFKAVCVEPGLNQVEFYYYNGVHSMCLRVFAAIAGFAAALALVTLFYLALKEPFAG